MTRPFGRAADALRPLTFQRGFIGSAAGSCLVTAGKTRVICCVTVEPAVPRWLEGRGQGWLTAEYAMLPASTGKRKPRDGRGTNGVDGRSVEIQRLIGRALRPVVDLKALGERTLHVDCDVIEADGGTRTAAINGAWVALKDAVRSLKKVGTSPAEIVRSRLAAISVGVVRGEVLLDLDYGEDSEADADMNVVMTGEGHFVEVQAAAEKKPFALEQMTQALGFAQTAILSIFAAQETALALPGAAT